MTEVCPVSVGQGRRTTSSHLSVVVEVPEVKAAHAVHGGKHGRMHGRPHDVIDIVRVVFEGVQRLVVLEGRKRERERGVKDSCRQPEREIKTTEGRREWRKGVSELQTERRCLSLGACLAVEPN